MLSRLIGGLLAIALLGTGLPVPAAGAEGVLPHAATATADRAQQLSHNSTATAEAAPSAPVGETAPSAQEPDADPPEDDHESPAVDQLHQRISAGVLATSRWFDAFFYDPRAVNEENRTQVRLRFSLFAEDSADLEFDLRVGARIDLPGFEERLQLLIAGDPAEEDDFLALTGGEGAPPELATSNENFSIALRYFLRQTDRLNISLSSGGRMRDGVPHLYLEPRYRQSTLLGSWLFRFTQRLTAFTDGTLLTRTTVDFDRALRQNMLFRATAEGRWDKDEHGYFYTIGPSVFQTISPRRAVVYSWANNFITHPSHQLDSVIMAVRYRQRIYRDWLFYEAIPQLAFRRDQDFDTTPGLTLRLEILFGAYPALPPAPRPSGPQ